MKGLIQAIESNIHDISSGLPWVLIGKAQSTRGYKYWDAVVLHEDDSACEIEFRKAHILLRDDPNAILINGYYNAWVGIDEYGDYESIKDVATRINGGYKAGFCKSSHLDIAMLRPAEMLVEYIRATDETFAYMNENDREEWLSDREYLIRERKLTIPKKI